MFLLDLHTFGATYDTSVKMEDVLQRKYGVDHAVVCEFSEAAATESESKHTDVPAIEDEPRESSSGEGSYETGSLIAFNIIFTTLQVWTRRKILSIH